MYLPFSMSRIRQREAQNARNNRAEIVKALADGEITKRDLLRMGIYTAGGLIVAKHGLSPFARSAYASGATGVPRSPLGTATKFSQAFERLNYIKPVQGGLTRVQGEYNDLRKAYEYHAAFAGNAVNGRPEKPIKRLSYHTDFTAAGLKTDAAHKILNNDLVNKLTGRGPVEGRPPGEMFSHQRWEEFFPQQAYILSLAQCYQPTAGSHGTYFHPGMAKQGENACWCYGEGAGPSVRGSMPPPLLKLRYGEPVAMRIYNNLPADKTQNGGFGRNESQLHFHNAHNGAESDGAANVHHFPGTFYDYRWSTTLARRDKINTSPSQKSQDLNQRRASGPDGNGGLTLVGGDYRELQGTLWAHDHRFFFTAENVYKGNLMMINMYSGPDRGHETMEDGVNLKLPSGSQLDYGNIDFDVNLVISDGATDQQGQYFFDIFTTDGFVGDLPLVNFQYAPVMEVLPRKYRFRLLNASMSRFIKMAIADPNGKPLPFQFIANDGNLVPETQGGRKLGPIMLTQLDEQGIAERYDIIVDFSGWSADKTLHLVNLLQQTDGRKPDKALSMAEALSGKSIDPVVGAIMQFKIVNKLRSVDNPNHEYIASDFPKDPTNPKALIIPTRFTDEIPIVAPVRTRTVEFGRGNGDSLIGGITGKCIPDCSTEVGSYPWIVKVNGQASHSMNANRASLIIPKAGEIEHWTYVNGGGGWDHPIHLHFEEGVTMNRGNDTIPDTERNIRKDVWRLRPSGKVTFQVQFGEYGGSYVNHCHNTVHEDFAMLLRMQLLGNVNLGDAEIGMARAEMTLTPNPTLDGVDYTVPEILPEGDPRVVHTSSGSGSGGTTQPTTATTSTPTTATTTTPAPATSTNSGGGGSSGSGGGSGGGGGTAKPASSSGSGSGGGRRI
jgi:FtsP/CotA-like multicopper oxidase with cupredoxin domain